MTKWLKNKLRNWIIEEEIDYSTVTLCEDYSVNLPRPLRFSVQGASGGTIVEVRHYDRKLDDDRTTMHVIPDGENVAENIGKIVTLELLKA